MSGLWRKSSFPFCFLSVSHISRSKFHIMIGVNVQYFWCATNPFTDRPFLNALPFYIKSASPPVPNSVPRSLEVKRKKINAESWLIRKNAFNLRTETLNAENVTVSCRCSEKFSVLCKWQDLCHDLQTVWISSFIHV